MLNDDARVIIENAIDRLELMRDQQSGGKWLENLTAAVGPYIKEWDIARVLDLDGMAGPRNGVPRLHQSGHRHRRRGRATQ